jgi:hypothetical protein
MSKKNARRAGLGLPRIAGCRGAFRARGLMRDSAGGIEVSGGPAAGSEATSGGTGDPELSLSLETSGRRGIDAVFAVAPIRRWNLGRLGNRAAP